VLSDMSSRSCGSDIVFFLFFVPQAGDQKIKKSLSNSREEKNGDKNASSVRSILLLSRQDKTRPGKARQDTTRQDKTRQDKSSQDKTRQDRDITRPTFFTFPLVCHKLPLFGSKESRKGLFHLHRSSFKGLVRATSVLVSPSQCC
jgi:hypothetical protein